jgi:PAS domain S-box-containing protein
MNPAIENMAGWSPSECTDKHLASFVHPDDFPLAMEMAQRALQGDKPPIHEVRILSKSGKYVLGEFSIAPFIQRGSLVGILGIGRDITIRKKLEKALKNQAHMLFQRVKELNCLFGISELLDKPGHSLDQILQGIVDLIPLGWQYPEITCAKLNLHKKIYATKNFKETIWKQTCDFHVHGDPAGSLKVCYLEEKSSRDDEPFLKEEKKLLKSIAERVGKIVEGKQAHEALWESEKRFHELFNNMSNGVAVYKAVNDGEDFIFVDCNKAGERIDNLKKETLIGKSLLEVYPGEKEFGLFDVLQRVWSTGNSEHTSIKTYTDGRFNGWRENYAYKLLSGEIVTVYDDITERIKAQEAMRKSEARYRALSEATFEAIFISEKGICLDTNQRAAELFGYDYNELIGIFGTDIIASESQESVKRKMLSGYEKPYEAIAQKKDGTKFYVEICGKMMKYKDKDVRMTVIRDINEQKRAAEALRESEKRYRDLFNSIPIGLYRTTPEGSILDVNPTMLEILGYPDQGALLQTKTLETYIYPDDRKEFQRLLGEKGFVHDFIVQLRRHDGRSIWVTINATIVHDPNGQMTYYEGAMADISDRKASENRIHKLSQQLMQAQEDERQMISRELHDTVAQDLSVAKMACDLIYNELLSDRLPEAQRIKEISGALQKTISGVRNMAYVLRPPGLEKLGLVETIYRFCEDFTQMWGLPVDFQSAGLKNLKLDYGIQINLYRLVQEGLTNIRKHAAAGRVTLKLAAAFPNIILRVEDNGRGFDVQARAAAADHEKRMGLRSMQERVTLLNGKMKLQSKPGQGTKVTIKLPFEEKESGAQENHLNR